MQAIIRTTLLAVGLTGTAVFCPAVGGAASAPAPQRRSVATPASSPASVAASASSPASATASASSLVAAAQDSAQLTFLLKQFLAGASVNDAAAHDGFWAEDLIYTGSSGRRIGKADIMKDVRSAPAPKPDDPKSTYTAEDIRIQQYGTAALVAFRLVATTVKADSTEVANYFNTGFFVQRDGLWKVVGWQATKIPPAPSR